MKSPTHLSGLFPALPPTPKPNGGPVPDRTPRPYNTPRNHGEATQLVWSRVDGAYVYA